MSVVGFVRLLIDAYVRRSRVWDRLAAEAEVAIENADFETLGRARAQGKPNGESEPWADPLGRMGTASP